jgi:hypothetical protein
MGFEIDARIWFEEENEAAEASKRFLELIKAIGKDPRCSQLWQVLNVRQPMRNEKLLDVPSDINIDSLPSMIAPFQGEGVKYSIYVPVKAWRFSAMESEDAYVMMGITVWEEGYLNAQKVDFATNGHAQISILDSGPFFELTDEKVLQHPAANEINQKVEENAERFINILLAIADALPIEKMYVYSDLGDYLPVNAHIGYFSNRGILIAEANAYLQVLRQGEGKIKPFQEVNPETDPWYFHELRPEDQRRKLADRLTKVLAFAKPANASGLSKIFDSGAFDYFEKDESLMAMDYPFFANSFLDGFFLSLIEESQA